MARHKMSICSECGGSGELSGGSHSYSCYRCNSLGITFNEKEISRDQIPTLGGYGLEKPCCDDNRSTRIDYWRTRLNKEKQLNTNLSEAKARVSRIEHSLESL